MIHDCSFVLCWLFMSPYLFWTVELSTVLQTNPPRSVDSAVFQHFCIFEPFPAVTVWFWDPSFHTEYNWGTQTQLLKKVQTCKNAGKLQNLQNVEDLSEEQCSVQLFRTNKGLMNNQHKTKEQSWIIQVTSHSIKNQGFPNFEGGYLNNFSYFCLVDYM